MLNGLSNEIIPYSTTQYISGTALEYRHWNTVVSVELIVYITNTSEPVLKPIYELLFGVQNSLKFFYFCV